MINNSIIFNLLNTITIIKKAFTMSFNRILICLCLVFISSTSIAQDWPVPKFHYIVEVEGGISGQFQEVSGLDTEIEAIEYRHGDNPQFSTAKTPGLTKESDITLKRGTINGDIAFYEWFNEVQMNTIERKTVIIKLINENGEPEITWTLTNAFPRKVQGTDLNSSSSEVAFESLILGYEGISINEND